MQNPERTLSDWLTHLEALHPKTIALGLERVLAVKQTLQLSPAFPIITVGGTNGKGSTCAALESILVESGYRVGLYSSPHLLRYNERVRINRIEASDAELCNAFAAIEAARGDIALTYFEFGTLAALWLFRRASIDVAVLEVGLGGRLDAVNAFDPQCALLTSVALDHMDYLGSTRESIGREKAGIFRAGKPALYGESDPPVTVLERAKELKQKLLIFGRDFGFSRQISQWHYWGPRGKHLSLPFPSLRGDYQLNNASIALAALDELKTILPVSLQQIKRGLLEIDVPARLQVLPGRPTVILDVAHNPHAAVALARNLKHMSGYAKTYAVFAMLADKDIAGVASELHDLVQHWFVGGIEGPRGASAEALIERLRATHPDVNAAAYPTLARAYDAAYSEAGQNDRILVFGSFHTVAEILKHRQYLRSKQDAASDR